MYNNCVMVLISLLYPIQYIMSHCFKHCTPILFRLVGSEPSALSMKIILQSKSHYVPPNDNARKILVT